MKPSRWSVALIVAAGLFATPAAAIWMAVAEHAASARRRLRVAAIITTAVLLGVLLYLPLRWEILAVLWGSLVVAGSALALVLRGRGSADGEAESEPGDEAVPTSGGGSGRDALRAAVVAIACGPPIALAASVVAAAALGSLLVRLDPKPGDPRELLGLLLIACLWAVPSMAVFAALSARRGRLQSAGDVLAAGGAWALYLFAVEFLARGSLRALQTQMLAAERAADSDFTGLVFTLPFVLAAVPLTLMLAWGGRTLPGRIAVCALLMTAATVNVGVLCGLPARAEFALARYAERKGDLQRALRWYAGSLIARSNPLIESYVQHRIGLLRYQLGDAGRAAAAFQLVSTTRGAHEDLVREASWYLERLGASDGDTDANAGRRVVLPGLSGPTEHRDSYCAPNTLSLVMRFWGREISAGSIGEEVALLGEGTALADMVSLADRLGFELLLHSQSDETELRWLIDRGIPVLVFIPGHVLSVFGYDDRLRTVVTYDTSVWDIWVDRPIPFLLEEWGERDFLMGIVLPRETETRAAGASPGAPERPEAKALAEARLRFAGGAAAAENHIVLSYSGRGVDDRRARLRSAITADPGHPRAALDLDEFDPRRWLVGRADAGEVERRATAALAREYSAVDNWAGPLSRWWLRRGEAQKVVDLSAELEQRGQLDSVREEAGLAAARLDLWDRAGFLFGPDDEITGEGVFARLRTRMALGEEDRAAESAAACLASCDGADLEVALEDFRRLAAGRGPVYLENALEPALDRRPYDVQLHLEAAEASLDAVVAGAPGDRRFRLQKARRALAQASAFAADAELDRARQLGQRLRTLVDPGAPVGKQSTP